MRHLFSFYYLPWRQGGNQSPRPTTEQWRRGVGSKRAVQYQVHFPPNWKSSLAAVILDHDAVWSHTASGLKVPKYPLLDCKGTEILSKIRSPWHCIFVKVWQEKQATALWLLEKRTDWWVTALWSLPLSDRWWEGPLLKMRVENASSVNWLNVRNVARIHSGY